MPALRSLVYVLMCLMGFVEEPEVSPERWQALEWVCKSCEILGPNEELVVSAEETTNFKDVIVWARGWMDELWDAPCLRDVDRLPSIKQAQYNSNLACNYLYYLRFNKGYSHFPDNMAEAIEVTEKRLNLWNLIAEVRYEPEAGSIPQGCYGYAVRRYKLKEIRKLVGSANYYKGLFPNSVPMVYMKEID